MWAAENLSRETFKCTVMAPGRGRLDSLVAGYMGSVSALTLVLRSLFGFRFNDSLQPCANEYADIIGEIAVMTNWSVA
jgi:hypothetical protein